MLVFLQKDGTLVQFADDRHATDEVLERYSMGRLAEPELGEFEEHLLACAPCQDRLAREDAIRQRVRDAAAILQDPAPAIPRRIPKSAWGLGLAAAALLIFVGSSWQSLHRARVSPTVIMLQTMRGADNPALEAAPAGKPLTLVLDLTDLEQYSAFTLEIVDAVGRPVFHSAVPPHKNRPQTTLPHSLAAGTYFVRVYAPGNDLLREYALVVRSLNKITP